MSIDLLDPKPQERAEMDVDDYPDGQAIASIEYKGYAISSGIQPNRELAISKCALIAVEMLVDHADPD